MSLNSGQTHKEAEQNQGTDIPLSLQLPKIETGREECNDIIRQSSSSAVQPLATSGFGCSAIVRARWHVMLILIVVYHCALEYVKPGLLSSYRPDQNTTTPLSCSRKSQKHQSNHAPIKRLTSQPMSRISLSLSSPWSNILS